MAPGRTQTSAISYELDVATGDTLELPVVRLDGLGFVVGRNLVVEFLLRWDSGKRNAAGDTVAGTLTVQGILGGVATPDRTVLFIIAAGDALIAAGVFALLADVFA